MSNHAPGPWSYDPGLSGKSAFVVDIEGHMIAMLPHADPRGLDNAKLIAAAPSMAQELQRCQQMFADEGMYDPAIDRLLDSLGMSTK